MKNQSLNVVLLIGSTGRKTSKRGDRNYHFTPVVLRARHTTVIYIHYQMEFSTLKCLKLYSYVTSRLGMLTDFNRAQFE